MPNLMPKMMSDVQVLQKMLEILRTGGWCQKANENALGQHCVMGARNVAIYGKALVPSDLVSPERFAQALRIRDLVTECAGEEVEGWNDASIRLFMDVEAVITMAMFKAAGKEAK